MIGMIFWRVEFLEKEDFEEGSHLIILTCPNSDVQNSFILSIRSSWLYLFFY